MIDTKRNLSTMPKSIFGFLLSITSTLFSSVSVAQEVPHNNGFGDFGFTGNVIWGGDKSDKSPIMDTVPPGVTLPNGLTVPSTLIFCWTKGDFDQGTAQCHDSYQIFRADNGTDQGIKYNFFLPNDDTITDWAQFVGNANGGSQVYGGNIERENPWVFRPLNELNKISWRIPDLAPFEGNSELTIYTAVNLGMYLSKNPNGFLDGNWVVGQTLDELEINIIDGKISGLEGIYFSTSDFTFDPNSETGWVPIDGNSSLLNSADFQEVNGSIGIIAEHKATVPESTSILSLLIFSLFGVTVKKKTRIR